MPGWPRSWANFSLLSLYSHRNAWANLHLLGQPNTLFVTAAAGNASVAVNFGVVVPIAVGRKVIITHPVYFISDSV